MFDEVKTKIWTSSFARMILGPIPILIWQSFQKAILLLSLRTETLFFIVKLYSFLELSPYNVVDTSHWSADVDGDDDVHGDDVHVGEGGRAVVEVSEEPVLVDDLRLTVQLHVIFETDVAGKALISKVVELEANLKSQLYIICKFLEFLSVI